MMPSIRVMSGLALGLWALTAVACQGIIMPPQAAYLDSQVTGTSDTPVATASSQLHEFSGRVERGEVFEQQIAPNLVFRLIPLAQDWEIWIGDSTDSGHNFSDVVTPPLYGINPRQIEGWHFRNSDNSGPNQAGEKNVNAPQYERRFCFVLNEADYQAAYAWLDAHKGATAQVSGTVESRYQMAERATGAVSIRELVLGNLDGERAWIERMEFGVEITVPGECD